MQEHHTRQQKATEAPILHVE